jgi:hypothetical protein
MALLMSSYVTIHCLETRRPKAHWLTTGVLLHYFFLQAPKKKKMVQVTIAVAQDGHLHPNNRSHQHSVLHSPWCHGGFLMWAAM